MEEATIAKVILSVQDYAESIIVCDDGSPDMTGIIAERLGAIVVQHERNMGKGKSIKTLLRKAAQFQPDIVVLLDGDGQHDPSEIPSLVKPIEAGEADFVVGSRYLNGHNGIPFYRKAGLSVIDHWLLRAGKTHVKDTQSGYRAMSRKAVDAMSNFDADGYGVDSEMLALAAKSGLKTVEVPINVTYSGLPHTSKKSPLRHGGELIGTVLRLVVEDRPLLFLGVPGAILLMAGLVSAFGLILAFNSTRFFSIPLALVSFGSTTCGLVLIVSSLILYALHRLKKERY